MKRTVLFALILALAACGDEPSLAPVAQAASPQAIAAAEVKPDPDKELAQRVGRAIEAAKLHGIDVVAVDGVVTLWGSAPSAQERAQAAQVAAQVDGVKSVENRLEVVTGS